MNNRNAALRGSLLACTSAIVIAAAFSISAPAQTYTETIAAGEDIDHSNDAITLTVPAGQAGYLVEGDGKITFGQLSVATAADQGHAVTLSGTGGTFMINGSPSGRSSITTTGNGAIGANINGGMLTLSNTDISTSGQSGAHAIALYSGSIATLTDTNLETKFSGGSTSDSFGHNVGLYVSEGSSAEMTGGSIKTSGVFVAYGVEIIGGGSTAELTNVNIATTGAYGSDGVRLNNANKNSAPGAPALQGDTGSAKITGGSITTSGEGSRGVFVQEYGTIDIDGTTINTSGPSGTGIVAEANTIINIANASIKTTGASAYGIQGGGTINIKNTTIETGTYALSGGHNSASLIYTGVNTDINLDGVTLISNGKNANGVWINGGAPGSGKLTIKNSTINTIHGDSSGLNLFYAIAEVSNTTFNISGTGHTIDTGGVIARNHTKVTLTDSTINSSNTGTIGIRVADGSELTMTGGGIKTTGTNGHLFKSDAISNVDTSRFTITGGTFSADKGTSFFVRGATTEVSLKDATVSSGYNRLLDIQALNTAPSPTQIANFSLSADNSTMNGMTTVDSFSTANLSLANGSVWNVQPDVNGNMVSVLTRLVNDNSTIAFSPPTGDPMVLASYMTVRTGSYAGNGGTIVLNTYLGGDGSPSDRLVIDGGTATGNTALQIVNSGGPGLPTTENGIVVVETLNGATTGAGAFRLAGRVITPMYEYSLIRGGNPLNGDPDDQNWYLRSHIYIPPDTPGGGGDTPGPTPVDDIREEVPLSAAIVPMAAEYGFAMLGTLHERVGETWVRAQQPVYEDRQVYCKDAKQNFRCTARVPVETADSRREQWFSGAWARVFGDRGSNDRGRYKFLREGPNYDYTLGGMQAGFDVFAHEASDGAIDRGGIYVGYGQLDGNVDGAYLGKAGTVDLDAYTVGAYWTHHAASGWYTDTILQSTWFSTDARSVEGERFQPDGWSMIASVEGGYAFRLGNGFTLEPQAQLAWQSLSFDDARDSAARFAFTNTDSLRGRLGVRLAKTWNMADDTRPRLMTGWLRANVWHEFLGDTETMISALDGSNPNLITASLGGTWGEIGAGVSGQLTDTIAMFASGAYKRSFDNKGRESWNGRLGAVAKW